MNGLGGALEAGVDAEGDAGAEGAEAVAGLLSGWAEAAAGTFGPEAWLAGDLTEGVAGAGAAGAAFGWVDVELDESTA